jgi:hypothetical protein
MRRDLHVMGRFCYLGRQEMGRAQAPQLETVRRIEIYQHSLNHVLDG